MPEVDQQVVVGKGAPEVGFAQVGIAEFRIIAEESSAAGIRRIEAITGRVAEEYSEQQDDIIKEMAAALRTNQVVSAIKKLAEENAEMAKQMAQVRQARDNFMVEKLTDFAETVGEYRMIVKPLDIVPESVKNIAFELRSRMENVAVVFGSNFGGKPTLTVALSDSAVALGLNAGAIVREAAKLMQGGGGGQPHYATAGGKNSEGLEAAMNAAADMIKSKLQA